MSTPDIRAVCASALAPVLDGKGSLNALDSALESAGVEGRDRGLAKALCFGVCRTLPRLEALSKVLLRQSFKRRDQDIQALLLLGLYQLLYMRVPAHAAVGETAGAARALGKGWATRVLNGCLRRFQRDTQALQAQVDRDPSIALLHPEWMLTRWREAWPDDWRELAEANNQPGPMTLRVNRRHVDRETYLARLRDAGLAADPTPYAPDGVTLHEACDVRALPGFSEGAVSVQDEAAQLTAPLLAPALATTPGARVLDACSAPGGKTAHLLEAFDLELTALDSDAERLSRVDATLARLGLEATTLTADASRLEWWDEHTFDAVLLDAPCSGTGVIRRHPDIKRLRRPNDIRELAALQACLLDTLWTTLAPGGTLLYATCSVMPEENVDQIAAFLARTPDASADELDVDWGRPAGAGRQLLPRIDGHDGFFYARLRKQST
nr:Ribosomal RNA small subunit methyltransferase B [Virgibacillus halodenitrificans]